MQLQGGRKGNNKPVLRLRNERQLHLLLLQEAGLLISQTEDDTETEWGNLGLMGSGWGGLD